MSGSRVAVVGAGAWGTTLASIIAGVEPVSLVCREAIVAYTSRNAENLCLLCSIP